MIFLHYSNSMTFSTLLKHSRPRFWHYLFGPMLVWWSYLFSTADMSELWGIIILIFVILFLYFLFPANLRVYGINDISDEDTDAHNDKKSWYEIKNQHGKQLLFSIIKTQFIYIFSILFLLIALFVITWNASLHQIIEELPITLLRYLSIFLVLIPFLILSYFYSAKPFRLKARPFRDWISNLLYIITPSILIGIDIYTSYWYLTSNFRYAFTAARLRCIAMHCFSAIPDIEPDANAGLMTTAVYLGKTGSLWYCIVLYAIAGILASQVIGVLWSLFGLVYCSMMLLWFRYDMFRIYKRFPYINFFVGMVLCFWIYFVL